jgi:aminoglycoside phosphotransferase (APT) family kinase protein
MDGTERLGSPPSRGDVRSLDLLARLVARHLGTDLAGLRLGRYPTGKFYDTYFVEGGPVPLVLRVAPSDDRSRMLFYEHRMMRQEPALHALLRGRTGVPEILDHDFTHAGIDRDYLLMERLPGTPISHIQGLTQDAFEDLLRQVGRCLRQVHSITGDRYGYVGEHRPMEPQPNWPSAFHVMWNGLLDDIERCGGYTPDEATRMRGPLDRHMAAFDRPVPASLLHMDIWAENILADESGRLTGLIDWDRACWGDPEVEFAVLDYCGVSEPPFWEGYGAERDTSPEAEVRRAFYLLYEVQKYIVIRRVRSNDPVRADGYRRQSLRLAEGLAGHGERR